jgi:hypothetical protein
MVKGGDCGNGCGLDRAKTKYVKHHDLWFPGDHLVKILHVVVGLNAGGAEHVLRRLIESHRGSLEFQYSIVSLTDLGALGGALIADGIDVDGMGMRGYARHGKCARDRSS